MAHDERVSFYPAQCASRSCVGGMRIHAADLFETLVQGVIAANRLTA